MVGGPDCASSSQIQAFSAGVQRNPNVRKEKSPTSLPRRSDACNSWAELFTVIVNETPDEDRLEALKAMFYSANRSMPQRADRVANHQLFQIAKKLTSGQFFYLRASYELFNANEFQARRDGQHSRLARQDWEKTGSRRNWLAGPDDMALIGHGLLKERLYADKSGIVENDAHMTPPGIKFCQNIEEYRVGRRTAGFSVDERI